MILSKKSESSHKFLSKEEYRKVLSFFRKASREEPHNPAYWYDIGFCKGKLGHWQEAASTFEKLVAEEPDRAAPFSLLGHCYIKLRRYNDAINVLRRAIELKPRKPASLYRLAAAYFYQNLPLKAAEPLKKILTINPNHVKAHFGMGLVYNRLQQTAKTDRQIAILQKLDPQMADKLRQISFIHDSQ